MSTMSGLHLEQLQEIVEQLTTKAENWQRIAAEVTVSEQALRLDNERLQAALQALADDASVPPWIRTLARESKP